MSKSKSPQTTSILSPKSTKSAAVVRSASKHSRNSKTSRSSANLDTKNYIKFLENKVKLMENELLPIREELQNAKNTVFNLEYEQEAGKRNEGAKINELTNNF
jgi:hypothetical protein